MNEISKQIEVNPEMLQKHIISLAQVMGIAKEEKQYIFPVNGDCLAGAGIDNGDFVAVSFRHFPRPSKFKSKDGIDRQDQCLCYARFPGELHPAVMIKQYRGVWGSSQMVGTRYKQEEGKPYRMNAGIFADEILGQQQTIHSVNFRDPQEVQSVMNAKQEVS